jgi:hypothetical protein
LWRGKVVDIEDPIVHADAFMDDPSAVKVGGSVAFRGQACRLEEKKWLRLCWLCKPKE